MLLVSLLSLFTLERPAASSTLPVLGDGTLAVARACARRARSGLARASFSLGALVSLAPLTTGCGNRQATDLSTTGGGAGAAGAPSQEPDWAPPVVNWPDPEVKEPFMLSQTGLYRDMVREQLAPDLLAFEPAHPLWSDGSTKQRWVRIPEGTRIDTSDMDHWQMP
ncbi:MAG TPA: hypothetical protein VFU02_02385, partial [Polyangiaceae bacterium]|nr:hypothetical protein [Polyangiaceae bacterium]